MYRSICLLLFSFMFSVMYGQSEGTIYGNVKDDAGMAVENADVFIDGTMYSVFTDANGYYELEVEPGAYILIITGIGFDELSQEVTVNAGERIEVSTQLISSGNSSTQLGEAVVVGEASKESERVLLNQQKEANVIVQSIGLQEMSQKAASNIEESLTKLSGINKVGERGIFVRGLDDRYNNLLLNGLRLVPSDPNLKNTPLNYIPTDVIRNIDVYKTFNVSLYQDFAGATFSVFTKDLNTKPETRIAISTGFNTQSTFKDFYWNNDSKMEWTGFQNGSRDLPSVYESLTGVTSTPQESANIFDTSWTPDKTMANLNFGIDISHNDRKTFSNGTKLGYLINFGFANEYMSYDNYQRRRMQSTGYATKDFKDAQRWDYTTRKFGILGLNWKKTNSFDLKLNAIYLQNTSNRISQYYGDNIDYITLPNALYFLRDSKFTENTSIVIQQLGTFTLGANDNQTLEYGISGSIGKNDIPDRKVLATEGKGADAQYITINGVDPFRFYQKLDNSNVNGRIDYQLKFGPKNEDIYRSKITVGANADYTVYDFFNRTIRVNALSLTDTTINTDSPNSFFDNNFNSGNLRYNAPPLPTGEVTMNQTTVAGYVNYLHNFGKLAIDLGVRVEHFIRETDYRLETNSVNDPFITETYNPTEYSPSINVRYEMSPRTNLRFSASRTITQARIREVLPFRYDEGDGSFIRGNPELENSVNYNGDLKIEFFPKSGSLLAATIFGKYIENPIERLLQYQSTGAIEFYDNFDEAIIYGLEIESKIPFDLIFKNVFWADRLSLGINGAAMQTEAKGNIEDFPALTNIQRPLQGASDFSGTVDLSYKIGDSSAYNSTITALFSTFSKRIYAVGFNGADDIYQQPFNELSFTWRNEFNKKFELNFSAVNILNSKYKFTQDAVGEIQFPETYSNVWEQYQVGANFNLEFVYKF